ncbi:LacI family DNA-binding transcriptional regulator [Paenibacillus lignilyticus]|uniref:LacI family DNA-binding transcriptional regulator n=1 Tax=Paenibacillus lignilyticus TaxID=1172615 RepID=A0ABS5CC77_9BACL|nr:LacI family DNA-binding transcriptional regulator [Paenibacillus lignilyticus]MBP3961760.1 LacI family DNA-binding transcriptional regulator [Paenibacillus lignilyticus]MBP3963569.1 LacI family DNA-binding transcriptional regulator [Paenibacillus lignilyticus]
MSATIKDVAKMAGVAVSTVSYALNNSPKISEETRRKVVRAAEALNFRPSGAARNLKKRKSETIGLFLNDLGGPFYSQVIEGVQEIVASHDYNLIVCSTYGGENSSAHRFLREKFVDGAIIMGTAISDSLILQVASESFPIVVLDRELRGDYVHNVLITNEQGGYDAVAHLIKLGRRNIEFLSGPSAAFDNTQRYEGYKRALLEHDLPVPKRIAMHGRFLEAGGYQAVKLLLASKRLPDAIFAANDEMAIGAIRALHEAGLRVPEDIAIVGFDNINLAPLIRPALSTIGHSKFEVGAIATQLVFNARKEEDVIILPTQLIARQSCGFSGGVSEQDHDNLVASILHVGGRTKH